MYVPIFRLLPTDMEKQEWQNAIPSYMVALQVSSLYDIHLVLCIIKIIGGFLISILLHYHCEYEKAYRRWKQIVALLGGSFLQYDWQPVSLRVLLL